MVTLYLSMLKLKITIKKIKTMAKLDLSDEEKKKIRDKHEQLEKAEKERKENLKNGVTFNQNKK